MAKEQVLWLEIAMADLIHVAVVEARHELFEIVPRFVFVEGSGVCYEVEELAGWGEFQNDIRHFDLLPIVLAVNVGADFFLFDYVGVLKPRHGLHFIHYKRVCFGIQKLI